MSVYHSLLVGGRITDVVRNIIDKVAESALRVRALVKQGMNNRNAEVCLRYLSGENELDI